MNPFFSILTRTRDKNNSLLHRCVETVIAQTCFDHKHVIIENGNCGLFQANKSLDENKDKAIGDYVYMLDDDDFLENVFVLEAVKFVIQKENLPKVVVVRSRFGGLDGIKMNPPDPLWIMRSAPSRGNIGTPNVFVERELWKETIHAFGTPRAGDYAFIRELWNQTNDWYWLDMVVSVIDRSSSLSEPMTPEETELYLNIDGVR